MYDVDKHHYHGGGWIESLENLLVEKNVTLAITFLHASDNQKIIKSFNLTSYLKEKYKA